MKWYAISKYAADAAPTLDSISNLYSIHPEVDPRAAAMAVLRFKELAESGVSGNWSLQTIGEAMGLLDRLNINWQPPAQESVPEMTPEQHFDWLTKNIPQESKTYPVEQMPAQTQFRPQRPRKPLRRRFRPR